MVLVNRCVGSSRWIDGGGSGWMVLVGSSGGGGCMYG